MKEDRSENRMSEKVIGIINWVYLHDSDRDEAGPSSHSQADKM